MRVTPFHERPEIRIAKEAKAKLTPEEYKSIVYVIKKELKAKTRANKVRANKTAKRNRTTEQIAKDRAKELEQIIKKHNAAFIGQNLSQRTIDEGYAATD